jgi:hypothetical protein
MESLIHVIEKQDRKLVRSEEAKAAKKEHRIALKAIHKDLRIESEASFA